MIARLRRRRSQRSDAGASAVEFALLAPVLFLVLFGIIDYGIWFADSISARQAVRDGARAGVVENFAGCGTPVTGADLANLACSVKTAMEPISGTAYVKISVATAPGSATSGAAWSPGNTLRVCAMTQHTSLMPLVPFPANGISSTKVEMPIEQATSAGTRATYQDTPPSGSTWSWCP
jgi:Flp pilus assembly protein TadG